jgi:toxin CcdB
MAQFDVFRFPKTTDLLLDVQSNRLGHISSHVVVPLVIKTPFLKPAPKLNPIFVIEDETYVMMSHYMTSVPARELRAALTNLEHEQYAIKSALDMLFYGF